MDLLTWPNVTLDQFQELLPELKHLEPSLKDRVMIEGNSYPGYRLEEFIIT
jgi:tRNA uridine 5-carboxymethylaminomethyl modification enzyme